MSALPECLAEEILEWASGVWQILTPPPLAEWRELSGVERRRWMSRALEETRPIRKMIGELQKLYGDEVTALIEPRIIAPTCENTCGGGDRDYRRAKRRAYRAWWMRKWREEQAKQRGGS